jgi:hypothetical protein
MTTIYRASDYCDARVGFSFSEDRETAEAYMSNPGFGGENIYGVDVELDGVLDLTEAADEWDELSEAAGITIDPAQYHYHFARVLPTSDAICEALAANGYHWVRFNDDFPADAVTIIPVSEDAADAADSDLNEC